MSTGGECQTCGKWFETQRYEDQGYGDCPDCENKKESAAKAIIEHAEEQIKTESDLVHEDNERMIAEAKAKAAIRHCNFCGRDEHSVSCLIGGSNAHICDQCSQMAADLTLKHLWDRSTRLQETIRDMEKHGGIPAVQGVSDMEIPKPEGV